MNLIVDYIINLPLFQMLIIGVVLFSFIITLFYLTYYYAKVVNYNLKSKIAESNPDMPISIVVIVKNELEYLTEHIHRLFAQEYSAPFQVVVVYLTSADEVMGAALDSLKAKYDNIYVTSLFEGNGFGHSNKIAYTIGAKAAKYEHLVFTSTSVIIKSKRWLSLMAKGFKASQIVSGYSRVEPSKGCVNRVTRCRNIFEQLHFMGAAARGNGYKLCRENMGYTKDIFFKSSGFKQHLRLDIGENDLLVQSVKKYSKTALVLNPAASVERLWDGDRRVEREQRLLSLYPKRFYPSNIKFYLTFEQLLKLFFLLSSVAAVVFCTLPLQITVAVLWVIKIVTASLIYKKLSKRTGEKIPYITLSILDIFTPFDSFKVWLINKFSQNLAIKI